MSGYPDLNIIVSKDFDDFSTWVKTAPRGNLSKALEIAEAKVHEWIKKKIELESALRKIPVDPEPQTEWEEGDKASIEWKEGDKASIEWKDEGVHIFLAWHDHKEEELRSCESHGRDRSRGDEGLFHRHRLYLSTSSIYPDGTPQRVPFFVCAQCFVQDTKLPHTHHHQHIEGDQCGGKVCCWESPGVGVRWQSSRFAQLVRLWVWRQSWLQEQAWRCPISAIQGLACSARASRVAQKPVYCSNQVVLCVAQGLGSRTVTKSPLA